MSGTSSNSLENANSGTACPERPPLFVAQSPLNEEGRPKIQRLLIANRGEIACRIIATCQRLNITSIAVYVEEDASSRHVSDADEAVQIGSIVQSATNPFLDIKLLIDVALSTGAQAIHPGYGYLSENAQFAEQVRKAGLTFIGPTATAMSTLGDKRTSKEYLRKHAPEVPLIPGFEGSSQNFQDLEVAAERIGYPVMLKASAGGGGKGIRIVRQQSDLRGELERAQSEATRSFGSSDCILEKYIEEGKHIEIQIIGDSHGKVVSLGERDCSVQRRHQKVIEETPCTLLTPETRQKMSAAAIRITQLIGYENAGTVEFVFDVTDNSFYFLEVNARLQVEHPITEEVTGIDLVALQLFVAAGGSLASLAVLKELTQNGHAIECRLCAEDPQRDFFPEHGKVLLWKTARQIEKDVRYETAIQTGTDVSIYFDSMIAKIVVWAPTRALAIEKMVKIMANTVCAGVKTNQIFLQSCLLHPAFHVPGYTTSFIQANLQTLLQNPYSSEASTVRRLLSVVPAIHLRHAANRNLQSIKRRPFSGVRPAFRNQYFDPASSDSSVVTVLNTSQGSKSSPEDAIVCLWQRPRSGSTTSAQVYLSSVSECCISVKQGTENSDAASEVTQVYNAISNAIRSGTLTSKTAYQVEIDHSEDFSNSTAAGSSESWQTAAVDVSINGSKIIAYLVIDGRAGASPQLDRPQRCWCHFPALGTWTEYRYDSLLSYCESVRRTAETVNGPGSKTVVAPMPCKVLSISKKNGDKVKAGESVMVVESMKMEMNISVAADGVFQTSLKKGDAVDEGKQLCSVV